MIEMSNVEVDSSQVLTLAVTLEDDPTIFSPNVKVPVAIRFGGAIVIVGDSV